MTLNRNGFQTFVNDQPPLAVVGDFASMNPRATALAGVGALRSSGAADYLGNPSNPIVGNFAWSAADLATRQKPVAASVLGFVANELQTLIPFLAASDAANPNPVRLAVQTGFPVTLFTHGDFWVIPAAPVAGLVSPGDTVYARQYDGAVSNDPTSFSATGVQATTVMTVSAVTKGALVPGVHISGTDAASVVVVQLTGTPGGAGTYTMSVSETVGSATITVAAVDTGYKFQSSTVADATSSAATLAAGTGVLTVGGSVTGTFAVGQYINGTGFPSNLFITAILTGTGGAGTYQTNTIGPAVTSAAITSSEGKLAKISRTY